MRFAQTRQPVSALLQVIKRSHHQNHIEAAIRPRQSTGVSFDAIHDDTGCIGPVPCLGNMRRHQIKQTHLVAHLSQPDGVRPRPTSNISYTSRRLRKDTTYQLLASQPLQRSIGQPRALIEDALVVAPYGHSGSVTPQRPPSVSAHGAA